MNSGNTYIRKCSKSQWTFDNGGNILSYVIVGNGSDHFLITVKNDYNCFTCFTFLGNACFITVFDNHSFIIIFR